MKKICFSLLLLLSLAFSTTQNSFAESAKKTELSEIKGVISDYTIVTNNYNKNSDKRKIKLSFPQIKDLKDKSIQNKINKLIKNTVFDDIESNLDPEYHIDYYADYTIQWISNKVLSLSFYGNSDIKEAPHPNNVFYTLNIDMTTGKQITLTNLINVNNNFITLFINKAKFLANPLSLDSEQLANLKNNLFNIEHLQYYFTKTSDFYFTSTGLVFSIGTDHSIGDYSLFLLNYSDMSNYLNQNNLWNNIKSDFPLTDYEIIRNQCFKTNLTSFGDVWFVSGFNSSLNGVVKTFTFYLIDKNCKVKYSFPQLFSHNLGYYYLPAISFKDVNQDGNKDIIIIASCNTNSYDSLDEVAVYLYNDHNFIADNKLNSYINKTLKDSKTIADVLKITQNYYKK